MLVNIHKLLFILILFMGIEPIKAQEIWTLKQCFDTALVYNKSLQINRNDIQLSRGKVKEVKSNLFPKITVNADYKYFLELPTQLLPLNALNPQAQEGQFSDLQFGVPHNINAAIQLSMPLYNAQLYGAMESAQIAEELSQLQYQKTGEQVLYDITILYYNAQILKRQLSFIDSNLLNVDKLLQNIQLLKGQLMAREADVSKVQLQAEQLETQRENILYQYTSILNALKLHLGINPEIEISVVSEIGQEQIQASKAKDNLEYQIIKTQSKLLQSELKSLTLSRYLPSLNLIASYGTTGFGYDQSPNNFLRFYPVGYVGIQLNYPLFNGMETQRKITRKNLELQNNQLQAQFISDKNAMEIENANYGISIAQSTISNTESQIALAKTIYDQSLLQQKMGTASLTDVLLADNALREAQQNYLNAVIDYLKAELELRRLTGELGVKN